MAELHGDKRGEGEMEQAFAKWTRTLSADEYFGYNAFKAGALWQTTLSHAALKSRDWTEDADHENGNYSCWCTSCESAFIGHKRRTTCKLCALSATPRIPALGLLKEMGKQRDECADALRALAKVVEDNFPMPAGVHAGSPLDRARKALASVPTYEQRLRNIAEGIGMTYDELMAAMKNRADGSAYHPNLDGPAEPVGLAMDDVFHPFCNLCGKAAPSSGGCASENCGIRGVR